jgi:hypothetical protein
MSRKKERNKRSITITVQFTIWSTRQDDKTAEEGKNENEEEERKREGGKFDSKTRPMPTNQDKTEQEKRRDEDLALLSG